MKTGLTRREFVALATGSGFALSGFGALSAARAAELAKAGGSDKGRKVLILGAGMAGLAAGLRLRELGYDVTVLEARSRPGGRVYTIREPFSDGLYAEAGAGRIPCTHTLTLQYVRRYPLELDPFYPQSGGEVFLWRGRRQVVPHGGHPTIANLPVNFTARERAAGFSGLSPLYFDRIREEIRSLPADRYPFPHLPQVRKYKNISYGEYLESQGASADAIQYLTSGFARDSLLDSAHDAVSHAVPMLWKIRGGNDLLPRAMASELREQIRYGAEVTRIEQGPGQVRVAYLSEGTHHLEAAESVICTIPFTVLRDIDVVPAFSAGKADAIRRMYLGPVTRVIVQTRARFWERQNLSGFATVDQPMEIWSPTFNEPGTRGIVMSYIYEDLARKYSEQSPQWRIERMLELYEQIHPGMRNELETATTWSWLSEKYSRGAFLVTRPGEYELLRHAGTPEGRIHFAGDHTSPWPGWIQGALHSGLRAAAEVAASSQANTHERRFA